MIVLAPSASAQTITVIPRKNMPIAKVTLTNEDTNVSSTITLDATRGLNQTGGKMTLKGIFNLTEGYNYTIDVLGLKSFTAASAVSQVPGTYTYVDVMALNQTFADLDYSGQYRRDDNSNYSFKRLGYSGYEAASYWIWKDETNAVTQLTVKTATEGYEDDVTEIAAWLQGVTDKSITYSSKTYESIFKGKIFCTAQDAETYTINSGVYTEHTSTNEYLYYNE